MDYFNNPRYGKDINIELKEYTDDENHPYANRDDTCYETLQSKDIFDEALNEHVYSDVKNDVYENTGHVRRDPVTRVNTLTRQTVENEYTSFEARHNERDSTYDTLTDQGKERASEIYSTVAEKDEDEKLRPGSIIGIYRNLKYVRTKRSSCIRNRWKLILLLGIVLLVGITGVITAVVLVTNEEEPGRVQKNYFNVLNVCLVLLKDQRQFIIYYFDC